MASSRRRSQDGLGPIFTPWITPNTAVASAEPEPRRRPEHQPAAGGAAPAADGADAATPIAVAYAANDAGAADGVPFDAVIKNGALDPNVVMPDAPATHAWVNNPLPPSVDTASELKCLATAIYFEARGEPEDGQLAVAQVVINRLKNPAYPDTICGVVYQNKNKRNRCQFSFACDGIPERVTEKKAWDQANEIAKAVISGNEYLTEVGHSTHYHATYVYPHWAPRMKKNTKIGLHVFYQFKRGWKFG